MGLAAVASRLGEPRHFQAFADIEGYGLDHRGFANVGDVVVQRMRDDIVGDDEAAATDVQHIEKTDVVFFLAIKKHEIHLRHARQYLNGIATNVIDEPLEIEAA